MGWRASDKLNYSQDDDDLRRHSAAMAGQIRRAAIDEEDDDPHGVRAALLSGQVRFPPNGWWTDCWFYVKNNHVLISIVLAHSSHPYTHQRRCAHESACWTLACPRHLRRRQCLRSFLVLLNSLSFAFFVTALFQVFAPCAGPVEAMQRVLLSTTLFQPAFLQRRHG